MPALIQALGDDRYKVRCAAAEALVKIGMPAVPALHKALTDENQDVCRRVCKVLGAIGDASSLEPLHSLRQRYPELEREIAQAIERIEAYTAWLREASAEVEDAPATDEPELPEQWLWATYDLAEAVAVGEDEEPSDAWVWEIDAPTEQASAEAIDTLPEQWLWETYSLAEQATVAEPAELLAWDEELDVIDLLLFGDL
ncbi:HEAT repeat domain-containing protein [Synechococcus sp. H70.1]